MGDALRSGELARLAGLSSDTLRHYERMGLLAKPPRTLSGYRDYPSNTLERVHLIRRALSVGFSLAKLTTILKIRDQGRSSLPPGTRYSPVETHGSQRKHQGVGRPAQAARTDSCKIGSETQERAGREASEIAAASGRSVCTGRRIKKWIAHGEKKTGTKITMKTAVLVMSMAVTLAASVPQET